MLRDGFAFKMGNGQSSLWYYVWLGYTKLCDRVDFVAIHDTQKRICDVVDGDQWRLERLVSMLPQELMEFIRKVPVSINASIPYCYAWKGDLSGVYTAKSGYQWATRDAHSLGGNADRSWSWNWNARVPQKFLFLSWLVCHDVIPSNML